MNKKTKLTQKEIEELWNSRAMYIVWDDGSDSLLQENGYTLDEALSYAAQGYEIYLD
jgi:hypothetical protein